MTHIMCSTFLYLVVFCCTLLHLSEEFRRKQWRRNLNFYKYLKHFEELEQQRELPVYIKPRKLCYDHTTQAWPICVLSHVQLSNSSSEALIMGLSHLTITQPLSNPDT